MTRNKLQLPFLITVGVATLACGSTVTSNGGAGGGDEGGGGATSGSGGAGGSVSTGSTGGGFGGGTVNPPPPECPNGAPDPYLACEEGAFCTYDVVCQSGTVAMSFVCEGGQFDFAPGSTCADEADSCAGTQYYCGGDEWWMPIGTNPPSPCPDLLPAPGEPCSSQEMGGVWPTCGYACDGQNASSGWTLATCVDVGNFQGEWSIDGACGG